MISFKEGQRWCCLFFVGTGKRDVMGGVWKEEGDDFWTIRYRIRTYKDEVAWDSQDEKVWFGGEIKKGQGRWDEVTEEEILKHIETVVGEIAKMMAKVHRERIIINRFIPVQGDYLKAAELLQGEEFTHMETLHTQEDILKEVLDGESPGEDPGGDGPEAEEN